MITKANPKCPVCGNGIASSSRRKNGLTSEGSKIPDTCNRSACVEEIQFRYGDGTHRCPTSPEELCGFRRYLTGAGWQSMCTIQDQMEQGCA